MDFADFCAGCHGAGGKGDGPAAAGLPKKPADLTRLAARNGGTFPTTRVMAQIWGYTGKKGDGVMPDFSPLMQGAMVPYDGGDGIETPTPIRLVAIAEYLKTLQVKR
jgi:mono/diheme cytochrome c family protein